MTSSSAGSHRSDPAQQPPEKGADYAAFPATSRPAGDTWYRQHDLRTDKTDNGAWWFSSAPPNPDDGGRFDLPTPHGTCYLASTTDAAIWERIGPDYAKLGWVWSDLLDNRVVSELRLPADVRAADVSSPLASGYRVTNELVATSTYALTQHWATTLHTSGFDGIFCSLRFTPGDSRGLALFGPVGAPDPSWDGDPTPQPIADRVHRLGIPVEDRPDPSTVTVLPPPV